MNLRESIAFLAIAISCYTAPAQIPQPPAQMPPSVPQATQSIAKPAQQFVQSPQTFAQSPQQFIQPTQTVAPAPQPAYGQPSVWNSYGPASPFGTINQSDRIIAEIGTIGLVREKPDQQVLAIDQLNRQLLNATEMQGGMHFGLKAMVDVRNVSLAWGGTDLQLGYFGINSLDAERTIRADQVNSIFFNGIPSSPPQIASINYSSNLYSGEANLRFQSYRALRPIVGLRYFKLEDNYLVTHLGTTSSRATSITNNSLFGGQLGLDYDLWSSKRINYYANGKVGLMHNHIEGSAEAANAAQNYGDGVFSNLVDTGVGVRIQLAGPISVKVGYQFLYASKLALGIDQNQAVSIFTPNNTVALNSQQWHGLNTTLVWEF